jgi:membrane protein
MAAAEPTLTRLPRRLWRVIRGTAKGMAEHEAGLRAAALAYQGLFSLFPLLLFLTFIASQVLTSIDVRGRLDSFLLQAIPTADGFDFLERIIDQTIDLRGSLGLIGLLGLLWTASALFTNLSTSLNVIWGSPHRSIWRRRLLAVAAVLVLGTLFLLAIVLSALPALPFLNGDHPLLRALDLGVGVAVEVLLFWLVYRWLSTAPVRSLAVLAGAVLAGLLWEAAQGAFRWYLTSGLTNYGAVYGTLASVIALILWAYLTGLILYLGAEFSAALQREFWPAK